MSNHPNVTQRQFFNDVVYQIEEVVKAVKIYLAKPINGTNIHEVKENEKLAFLLESMVPFKYGIGITKSYIL